VRTLKPRAAAPRPSPEEALRVATATAPAQPPAQVPVGDRPTTLNLRVRESTVVALAAAARGHGLTMKQVVCQALAQAGVDVAPADLEDRTPRRRA
jgi:ribosomal protein S5